MLKVKNIRFTKYKYVYITAADVDISSRYHVIEPDDLITIYRASGERKAIEAIMKKLANEEWILTGNLRCLKPYRLAMTLVNGCETKDDLLYSRMATAYYEALDKLK